MDVMNPEQRHKAMAHNRGRTKPELALARALWSAGARYLTHPGYRKRFGRGLPGSPDLIFPSYRTAIFVDGCFWHGCPECSRVPSQSGEFWARKIAANQDRDRRVTQALQRDGWRVIRVPEHHLRSKASISSAARDLAVLLHPSPSMPQKSDQTHTNILKVGHKWRTLSPRRLSSKGGLTL